MDQILGWALKTAPNNPVLHGGLAQGGRRTLAIVMLAALLSTAPEAAPKADEPTDGHGNIGATSYETLPFVSRVYANCWACSAYLEPGELFFEKNPSSFFNTASVMAAARYSAGQQELQGIVPTGNQQRWEDTYAASFPVGTFPNAPAYVASDSKAGNFPNDGAFVAWRNFITTHPQYWDTAFDGGTMPSEPTYFRSWGGQWGYINPLTPLDAADCPPGKKPCTWGDLYAYRWAKTAALSGGYGIALSDFADSQPGRPANYQDFNPRLIALFATSNSLTIPGGTVPAQAAWIVANAAPAWNDFLANGWGAFFAALSTQIGKATHKKSPVIDQCGWSPSFRRWYGTDERIDTAHISPSLFMCIWDDQLIQSPRSGPVVAPPAQELAGYVLGAAREPLMRNGANIEADDDAYWAAIAQFYPTLSAADQQEVGYKLLKRLWLWSAWAHIADRAGHVRRAIAFASRDYWDLGTLTALDPLTTLIQSIVPSRPFGPAIYYSTAVERAREQQQASTLGVGTALGYYLAPPILQAFVDAGGGVGYYVSDAALPTIRKDTANAPSAWVVLDAQGEMPQSELNALTAIAPVVSTPAGLAAAASQPLLFGGGLTGFGFYDQSKRLIIVVTNPSTQPGAGPVSGTVSLSGIAAGTYTVTDLFTNATTSLTVRGGKATMAVTEARWDTNVFAVTKGKS